MLVVVRLRDWTGRSVVRVISERANEAITVE